MAVTLFDFDDLKSKINENTKLLLLSNPQNPGGMVWTKDELTTLANICLENKIMIISDEIHSDLIFEGQKHIPLPSLSEEIAHKTAWLPWLPAKLLMLQVSQHQLLLFQTKPNL